MDRRQFINSALTGLGALAVGTRIFPANPGMHGKFQLENDSFQPGSAQSDAGTMREISLVAEPAQFEVGNRGVFERWLYNGRFPGPEIRAHEGERLRVTLTNKLSEGTTVHWHGLPVPNPMDGVPEVTQPAIPPGGTFIYEFEATPSGSFMYHSHFRLQPDRGLVGPLVVEEKKPHIDYDRDYTLVLTDFLSGAPGPLGSTMNGSSEKISMQVPPYVVLLINGHPPDAPAVFNVKTGERVRMRLINPSGTTIYRLAVGGHPVTVTHADGRPVEPFRVDALHIAPGERYDILVDARSPGAWPIAAHPDNDLPPARAILRYMDSNELNPREGAVPEGLSRGRMLQLGDLRSLDLPEQRKPNRTFNLTLSGGMRKPGTMMGQEWLMNGQAYPNADPLEIRRGESVRLRMVNQSAMPHPVHLHGHFFRVGNVIKDTAIVWTQAGHLDMDFVANNPGAWFFHCHNLYHMEAGMARLLRYVSATH
jgi:multicopper oxidase